MSEPACGSLRTSPSQSNTGPATHSKLGAGSPKWAPRTSDLFPPRIRLRIRASGPAPRPEEPPREHPLQTGPVSPHTLQELAGAWRPTPAPLARSVQGRQARVRPASGLTGPLPGAGAHTGCPGPSELWQPSCPSAPPWGPASKGRAAEGLEELAGRGSPATSLEACPLPQDPRAAKAWPGPSLTLPLLAAPPKGAAADCAARKPQDLGRRLRKGGSEGRVCPHGGQNSGAPRGSRKERPGHG